MNGRVEEWGDKESGGQGDKEKGRVIELLSVRGSVGEGMIGEMKMRERVSQDEC